MKQAVMFLTLAILTEAFGSTMLKFSDGFTILWASIGVAAGFLISFVCMSFALKHIPLSTAYATWSAIGTALTAIIGVLLFAEHLSGMKVFALALVIGGIVILNKSRSTEETPAATDQRG